MKQQDHYRQILRLANGIGRLTNPQHLPGLRDRRISLAQFLALDVLAASADSMRMSEIAESAGLAASELTRVISGLEREGLVKRKSDPDDNRAVRVALTRKGRETVKVVHREATSDLREVWTDFTHDEWHHFIDLLNRFESGLRRVRAGQPRRPTRTT